MDLIDNEAGVHYAEPLRLGLYQTGREEIVTTEQLDLKSKSQTPLAPWSFVDICEISYLTEEHCIRGRLKSGEGWISLYSTIDENDFAIPILLGAYCILDGVSITENEEVDSKEVKFLTSCSFCDVIEVKLMETYSMIRGRLSSGWINICNTSGDMQRWAESISLGVYEASINNKATFTIDLDSDTLYELVTGTLMQVVETRLLETNGHLRGRLLGGGWVTLLSDDGNTEWTKPLHIGIHKMISDQKIYEKSRSKSSRKKITAGRVTVVTELRLLSDLNVVRGKLVDLDSDGWIDLIDIAEKNYFVKPLPLGRYKIVHKTFQTTGASLRSKVGKKVKKGTIVEVCYIQIMTEDQRVRARLITGGWISLMNTSDGFEWAEYVAN